MTQRKKNKSIKQIKLKTCIKFKPSNILNKKNCSTSFKNFWSNHYTNFYSFLRSSFHWQFDDWHNILHFLFSHAVYLSSNMIRDFLMQILPSVYRNLNMDFWLLRHLHIWQSANSIFQCALYFIRISFHILSYFVWNVLL